MFRSIKNSLLIKCIKKGPHYRSNKSNEALKGLPLNGYPAIYYFVENADN